ncbi:phage tail tape measure protein [Pseudomonas tolaasii]|uniref:Phage tail tape measure protein n=5 Tax=Pseudomonas tolaasii TaxID=29442 RepID=A0A7Y8ASR7_PSETO|nr:phage tail tape measure protein [Pseudomonas tolaasii]MBY8941536.1 phage tail tape measure protein [Pseudomonas tolaasii]NWC21580.1 phage tail tape measure protein [Pseudomonas tolaasii]NWD38083.1 phage tail tape measure protein [Pseudomonas tolaasii]PKA76202.1 TP901 family phage tail tape measure protein [Pseudomonas tolaasii NCPPB 2192]
MANDLRLQVLLSAIDQATGPLKKITGGSQETARALKAARDRLKELNTQQRDVIAWRELQAATKATSEALAANNSKVGELARTTAKVRQQLAPTQALFEQSRQKVDALKTSQSDLKRELTGTRNALGLLGDEHRQSGSQIAALNAVMQKGNALTREQQAEYTRLTAAQRERKTQLDQLAAKEKTLADRYTLSTAQLRTSRAGHSSLRDEILRLETPFKAQLTLLKQHTAESKRLGEQYGQQQVKLGNLGVQLKNAGISTNALGAHELKLKRDIDTATQAMKLQMDHLDALKRKQDSLAKARATYDKTQSLAGSVAVSGAAGLGVGYAASRPVVSAIKAFAPNEDSATQLKVSMMDDTGKVSADFQKITDLATKLGDRLPGTTADFQNMMTMLRRQGISAQSILGGTGEAAAYLGVQMKMEATQAAEFAAKMQDATRTTEKDMMGLMDTIQRGFYAGMDPSNMIQGFSKISPVMDVIKKSGIDAAKELAPLLIMMDQASMDGSSAGNAFRKIFQAGLNQDKVDKANSIAAGANKGVSLKFTDDKGNFAGLENLYAQVEKLKVLNDTDRTAVISKLFGDDAETMTTLNTMMNKGLAGYQEIQEKLRVQADLRTRVNEQLGTLTNVMEAAEGSFTNAMAEFGAAVAPDLKDLINTAGEIANRVGTWARENPKLAAGLVKVVAAVAAAALVFGTLALTMASMLGPFAVLRYGMALFGIRLGSIKAQLIGTRIAAAGAGTEVGRMGRIWKTVTASHAAGGMMSVIPTLVSSARIAAVSVLPMLGGAISAVGAAILATPVGWLIAAVTGLVAIAALIYKYWKPIKGFFLGFWQGLTEALQPVLAGFGKFGGLLISLAKAAYSIPIIGFALRLLGSIVRPLFSMISSGISGVIGWFTDLLKPVEDVGGAAQSMGQRFGAAIGNMLMTLMQSIGSIVTGAVNVWNTIKASFDQGLAGILQLITNFSPLGLFYQAFAGVMNYFGVELPGKFAEFGGMIVNGLVNGLTAGLGAVKGAISSIADSSIGWFKEKLGIHSPSRVFAELGGFTMEGLTKGLEGGQKGPLNALSSMSKQLTAAGTLALSATVMPALAVDDRPPISSAGTSTVYDSHDTYQITIAAAPGMDMQAMEKSLRAMLNKIENEKRARQRSKLSDRD